jgi:hypothetical protein
MNLSSIRPGGRLVGVRTFIPIRIASPELSGGGHGVGRFASTLRSIRPRSRSRYVLSSAVNPAVLVAQHVVLIGKARYKITLGRQVRIDRSELWLALEFGFSKRCETASGGPRH